MKFSEYLDLFLANYELLVQKKSRSVYTLKNVKSTIVVLNKYNINTTKIDDLINIFPKRYWYLQN